MNEKYVVKQRGGMTNEQLKEEIIHQRSFLPTK